MAAGVDLRADLSEPIELAPLGRALVPTGLYMQIPEGYEGQVRPRSGLAAKKGVTVLNTPQRRDFFLSRVVTPSADGREGP